MLPNLLERDFPGCDAFSKAKVILRRCLPCAARMCYMKLGVQLQGVSVTGYRVKADGEDKKKKHTNDTIKNQLDRQGCQIESKSTRISL
jgi:hypothetical protein